MEGLAGSRVSALRACAATRACEAGGRIMPPPPLTWQWGLRAWMQPSHACLLQQSWQGGVGGQQSAPVGGGTARKAGRRQRWAAAPAAAAEVGHVGAVADACMQLTRQLWVRDCSYWSLSRSDLHWALDWRCWESIGVLTDSFF